MDKRIGHHKPRPRHERAERRGQQMTTILSDTRPIARKTYTCRACEWIENDVVDNYLHHYKFTYAELREIVKARRNRWQIVPGQQYRKQTRIDSDGFCVWRVIPAIDAICRKYNIYEYD